MSPRLPLREVRVVLRDGTRALIRPVRPDDEERLQILRAARATVCG